MKMKSIAILLGFWYPLIVFANRPINDYLLAAETDISYVDLTGLTEAGMGVVSSWIENAQFRANTTATDSLDFQESDQSFEIRIKPKAWGQRDAEKEILELRLNQHNNTYNQLFNLALKERYLKILDYIKLRNRTHYLFKLSDLLPREIEFNRSLVLTEKFNAEKLLDIERELEQTKGMAGLNLARLNIQQSKIGIPLDTSDSLLADPGMGWVVQVADIYKNISGEAIKIDQSSPAIVNERIKLKITQAENDLVKSKRQIGIDLLRFRYEDSRTDETAFLMGINIPLGTSFGSVDSQYDLYEGRSRLNNRIITARQKLDEIQIEIAWVSKEHRLIEVQIQRLLKRLQTNYSRMNPTLALNLGRQLIEYKKQSVDVFLKSLNLYINYLAISGQLIQQPLRNWIQQGVPELVSVNTH